MMVTPPITSDLQKLLRAFVRSRLEAKLEKLKPDEVAKREELERAHDFESWVADAARRAPQLTLASHTVKPLHPDARGSNLRVTTPPAPGPGLVGSHSLPSLPDDVVGNAAALDVFKFLSLEYEGTSILQLVFARDDALGAALSSDGAQARAWMEAFASIAESPSSPASHTLAKQLYFPLEGETPYHLLAPLFPTSFIHVAQSIVREHRFSDEAKAARAAYYKGEPHPVGFADHPNLAVQKLGGTKPQNISQLNSERRGENWLLASMPPHWRSSSVLPIWSVSSVFDSRFGRLPQVRDLTRELKAFLEGTTRNNVAIRDHRARLVQDICDEAHQFAARHRELEPGWTADPRCDLNVYEQIWLDPFRDGIDDEFDVAQRGDWMVQIGRRFGNWLNASLRSEKLPMGEVERDEWLKLLSRQIKEFEYELENDRD